MQHLVQQPCTTCISLSQRLSTTGRSAWHQVSAACAAGGWHSFNDSKVTGPLSESEIVSDKGYVLFYRRRPEAQRDDGAFPARRRPAFELQGMISLADSAVRRAEMLAMTVAVPLPNPQVCRRWSAALHGLDPAAGRSARLALWDRPAVAAQPGLLWTQAPSQVTHVGNQTGGCTATLQSQR